MSIINENSLALTLDSLNETFFFYKPLTSEEKTETAKWLAGRQGQHGSYARMFAPTKYDIDNGVQLFTGEIMQYVKVDIFRSSILIPKASRPFLICRLADKYRNNSIFFVFDIFMQL